MSPLIAAVLGVVEGVTDDGPEGASQQRRERRHVGLALGAVVLLVLAGVVVDRVGGGYGSSGRREPAGVQTFTYEGDRHVEGPIAYPERPPVGGEHSGIWQNCGAYDAPIADEHAVHSLEHGAVWIAYRPDLPEAQIETLRSRAEGQTYVLVSPYPGLASVIVVTAWNHQLRLETWSEARIDEFIRDLRLSSEVPESGAPCTGGRSEAG